MMNIYQVVQVYVHHFLHVTSKCYTNKLWYSTLQAMHHASTSFMQYISNKSIPYWYSITNLHISIVF